MNISRMTDDSMSDDVFEDEVKPAPAPSPLNTGYRDYEPPPDLLNHYATKKAEEDLPIHKVPIT